MKHYDLQNTSMCDFAIFQKFCLKIGIQVYTVPEFKTIFNTYDYEGQGSIHHKILTARMLGKPEPENLATTVGGKSTVYAGSPGKHSQIPKSIDPAA